MSTWLVLLGVAAGTYAMRASMFVLLGDRSLPAWTTRPMALVAPAAVTALVTSMLFAAGGGRATLPELAAISTGFVAARRSGNVMHAFYAGMPVYWLLTAALG